MQNLQLWKLDIEHLILEIFRFEFCGLKTANPKKSLPVI